MKNVLLVITKANWGGAQKYVFEMATKLPKDQFNVQVVCGQGDILTNKLKDVGIPVIQIPELGRDVKMGSDQSSFAKLLKIFKSEKPDIVHLNSSKIGGLGALAARMRGVKTIVFTVHGFAFNEDRSGIQKLVIKVISWLTLFLSTHVICISEQEYNLAKKWPFISKKLRLIHNGVIESSYIPQTEARAQILKVLNKNVDFFASKKVVGTIAELTKNKGLEYAVKAFKSIPDALYVIIGGGEQKEYLSQIIKEQNLEDKVFLAGYVSDAAKLLKAFDVFLLPSLKEGVPYVILEAGLAQVPVVATNVGGVSEVIDHASGNLISPKSEQEITDAIQSTLSSQTHSFTDNLYAKVKREFSHENMLSKTIAVYSKN